MDIPLVYPFRPQFSSDSIPEVIDIGADVLFSEIVFNAFPDHLARRVLAEPGDFTDYNAAIASTMPLRALPEIARDMIA